MEEKVEKKIGGPIGMVMDVIGGVLVWVDKYGLKKMLKAFGFCALVCGFIFFMFSTQTYRSMIAQTAQDSQSESHTIGTEIRSEASSKINSRLLKMTIAMGADRAFILEMHNGKENPTNLPFNYVDMTYEEINDANGCVEYISDGFENLNMGRYNFPYYITEHNFFIGDVEAFKAIDKKMGYRLIDEEVGYIALVLIKTSKEIGFLGVTYKDKPEMDDEELHGKICTYVQEIACLLDYSKQRELYGKRRGN